MFAVRMENRMTNRFRGPIAGLAAVASMLLLTNRPPLAQAPKGPSTSKTWIQPKTPWGDPDLQGTWTSDDCIRTPMNRPAQFGDRLYMTADEIAQREQAIATQQQTDAKETAEGQAVRTGPPPHWG